MKDVESLYDCEYVNDEILGFVAKCLDFVHFKNLSQNSIPNVVFGMPLDMYNISMKNKVHCKFIEDHLTIGDRIVDSSQMFADSERLCTHFYEKLVSLFNYHYYYFLNVVFDPKETFMSFPRISLLPILKVGDSKTIISLSLKESFVKLSYSDFSD